MDTILPAGLRPGEMAVGHAGHKDVEDKCCASPTDTDEVTNGTLSRESLISQDLEVGEPADVLLLGHIYD